MNIEQYDFLFPTKPGKAVLPFVETKLQEFNVDDFKTMIIHKDEHEIILSVSDSNKENELEPITFKDTLSWIRYMKMFFQGMEDTFINSLINPIRDGGREKIEELMDKANSKTLSEDEKAILPLLLKNKFSSYGEIRKILKEALVK